MFGGWIVISGTFAYWSSLYVSTGRPCDGTRLPALVRCNYGLVAYGRGDTSAFGGWIVISGTFAYWSSLYVSTGRPCDGTRLPALVRCNYGLVAYGRGDTSAFGGWIVISGTFAYWGILFMFRRVAPTMDVDGWIGRHDPRLSRNRRIWQGRLVGQCVGRPKTGHPYDWRARFSSSSSHLAGFDSIYR